ncbi:MAG: hypothetical protein H0U87_11845 [Acidobacteria bacterium]|nr:hypothetical protein [Acidobacteriota bacterium]
MIDPADDEINIFLPLMFLIFIGVFLVISAILVGVFHFLLKKLGVTDFLLEKFGVSNAENTKYYLVVLKDAALSIIGTFVILGVLSAAFSLFKIILNFFSK